MGISILCYSIFVGAGALVTSEEQLLVLRFLTESWRWLMWAGGWPILLGLVALLLVPESPEWKAAREREPGGPTQRRCATSSAVRYSA